MPDKELMKERKRLGFLGLPFTFTKYIITDKKLLIESGLFTSNENEILLYKVFDMTYSRSFLQKLFGQSELEKQRLSVRRGEFMGAAHHHDHMHHADLPDDDFNDAY